MYRTFTGKTASVRPVVIYNNIMQEKKVDNGCAGDDAK
jgi:hypothetical protein